MNALSLCTGVTRFAPKRRGILDDRRQRQAT
jgi:hypothetical protein